MRIHTEPVRPIEEVDEEGAPVKVVTKPKGPTQEEWEEHMVTHIPYRNWCPFCVKGQGRQDAHAGKMKEELESRKPTIVMDYAYMNNEGKELSLIHI